MARRLLSVAGISSATIALTAGTVAPAFALDNAPSAEATEVAVASVAAADSLANLTENLADGDYVTAHVDANGTADSYQAITEKDLEGLAIDLEAKTLTVGDKLNAKLDRTNATQVIKDLGDNGLINGYWETSDKNIFTVQPDGAVEAIGEGAATLSFTPARYDADTKNFVKGDVIFTLDVTVEAAAETPAPAETTAAPEASEEATPAPAETTAAPVAETPAPAETTSAPAETIAPAPETPASNATEEAAAPVAAPAETTAAPAAETPVPAETTAAPAEAAPVAEQPVHAVAADQGDAPVVYQNCRAVWDALGGPINENDEGYAPDLDADGDGTGCEQNPDYQNKEQAAPVNNVAPVAAAPAVAPAASLENVPNPGESALYPNCDAVGVALGRPITTADAGYGLNLDSDGDGVGCENLAHGADSAFYSSSNYSDGSFYGDTTYSDSGYYAADGTYYENGYDELAYTGFSNGQLALAGLSLAAAGGLVLGGASMVYRGRHFA